MERLPRTTETTADFLQRGTRNLILWDPEPRLTANAAFSFLTSLSNRLNESPTNLDVQIGEKSFFPPLKRGIEELRTGKFDNFRSLGISTPAFIGERADVLFLASISFGDGSLLLHFDESKVQFNLISEIIKHVCANLGFSLGYYWRMKNKDSPLYFGRTVISASTPINLRNAQANFANCYYEGLHKRGYIRDVFRLNILSKPHLDALVDNMPLNAWISESSNERAERGPNAATRGTLVQLSDKNWLWDVDPIENENVRRALVDAGMIMAVIDVPTVRAIKKPS